MRNQKTLPNPTPLVSQKTKAETNTVMSSQTSPQIWIPQRTCLRTDKGIDHIALHAIKYKPYVLLLKPFHRLCTKDMQRLENNNHNVRVSIRVIALDVSSVCVRQCWLSFLGTSSLTVTTLKYFNFCCD
ncbi:hypothetical protein VNO77_43550 [Canavalia gladiata]|uniref:Uncharacterized protein n=1 Tax=Canavalia gladiata TaxID=3824 RepID=A0AAN9PQ52_CANGL